MDLVIAELKPRRGRDDVDPAAMSGSIKIFLTAMDEVSLMKILLGACMDVYVAL